MTSRVLHVISQMEIGGAETLVRELALRGRGVVAVASSGGPNARILGDAGVRTYDVPAARRSVAGAVRAVLACRAALGDFRPTAVFTHNISATVVCRLAVLAGGCSAPLVAVFHGVADGEYRTAATLLRLLRVRTVAVSEVAAERLVRAGVPRSRVMTIPSAVAGPSGWTRALARAALGIDDGTVVVLSVARLAPQKRHDVLLRSWARAEVDAVLLVAGEGPTRATLEELARVLAVEHSVRFLGERQDVPALLAAADVFVLSTDWEGRPVAVLEALAAGLPVVASDVDGVSELLRAGGGVLVPPRDEVALSAALRSLVQDAGLRRRHADDARGRAGTRGSLETMVAAYEELAGEMHRKQRA